MKAKFSNPKMMLNKSTNDIRKRRSLRSVKEDAKIPLASGQS